MQMDCDIGKNVKICSSGMVLTCVLFQQDCRVGLKTLHGCIGSDVSKLAILEIHHCEWIDTWK